MNHDLAAACKEQHVAVGARDHLDAIARCTDGCHGSTDRGVIVAGFRGGDVEGQDLAVGAVIGVRAGAIRPRGDCQRGRGQLAEACERRVAVNERAVENRTEVALLACAAGRLVFARIRRERNNGWIFYVAILILALPLWLIIARPLERIGRSIWGGPLFP